jgi:hypothetical protein
MNQALYAHMNNKRKMKKKKRTFVPFVLFLWVGWWCMSIIIRSVQQVEERGLRVQNHPRES